MTGSLVRGGAYSRCYKEAQEEQIENYRRNAPTDDAADRARQLRIESKRRRKKFEKEKQEREKTEAEAQKKILADRKQKMQRHTHGFKQAIAEQREKQAAARERKHARQLKSWADTIKHEEALESWEQQQQRDRDRWAAEQLVRARAVDADAANERDRGHGGHGRDNIENVEYHESMLSKALDAIRGRDQLGKEPMQMPMNSMLPPRPLSPRSTNPPAEGMPSGSVSRRDSLENGAVSAGAPTGSMPPADPEGDPDDGRCSPASVASSSCDSLEGDDRSMLGGVVNVDGSVDLFQQLEFEAEAGCDAPSGRNGTHRDDRQHYHQHHRPADEERLPPARPLSPRHRRHYHSVTEGGGDADIWAMPVELSRRSPNGSALAPAAVGGHAWSRSTGSSNGTSSSVAPPPAPAVDMYPGDGDADAELDHRRPMGGRSKRQPSTPHHVVDESHLTGVSPRESPRATIPSGEPRPTRSKIASRIPHPPQDTSRIPHPPQRMNRTAAAPAHAGSVSAQRRQRPGVNYEIKSGRTPTDDEINVLWNAVRQGLQAHRDEQHHQSPSQQPQQPMQQHQPRQFSGDPQSSSCDPHSPSSSSQNGSRGHTSSGQSSRIRAESALALAQERGPGSSSRKQQRLKARLTVSKTEALAKTEAELLNSLSKLDVKIGSSSYEKAAKAKGPRVRKARRVPHRTKEQSAALRGSVNDASAALAAMAAANLF